jgi:long-chain acyl-CoA synthetase
MVHRPTNRQRSAGEIVGPAKLAPLNPEDRQLLQRPAARAVWEFLADHYPDRDLTLDSNPELDLGMDSLGWVSLGVTLREQGVEIPEGTAGGWRSLRDLLRVAVTATPTGGGTDLVELLRRPEALLDPRQRRWLSPRPRWQLPVLRGGHAMVARLCQRRFGVRVEGELVLPPAGPFLLAPRHLSVLDPVVLASALDAGTMQRLRWAGWTGMLFNGPLRRLVSRISGVLPVDPIASPRSSLAFGAAALAAGHGLVWFPEGRRSPDGELQPLRSGVGLLLAAHPVPVVPVWIEGTDEAMPIGQRWPRRAQVTIRFGAPVDTPALATRGEGETAADRITDGLALTLRAVAACDNVGTPERSSE